MLIPFKELFSRHRVQTKGVLHLGASTGQEAPAYAEQGIQRVIWVEAHPAVYAQLAKEVSRYPGSIALLACIGEKDEEEVTFHVANNGGQSSSLLEFGTHSQDHPSVKFVNHIKLRTTRVDTLLKQRGLSVGPGWFLNIDLQGAELLALRSMGNLIRQFDYAYIEVNEKQVYKGCPLVREIDSYLMQFGMVGREVKMTNAGWGDKFYSTK